MCKENFIHVCFIIDESGSMGGSENDVVGGFNKTINEQKAIEAGQCAVSFFSFNTRVNERFIGKDVSEVKPLEVGQYAWGNYRTITTSNATYASIDAVLDNSIIDIGIHVESKTSDPLYQYTPGGGTAMNDAIGTAINKIGKWLSEMPEEERPSKNLIVIMTDGEENSSREYSLSQIKDMIQHQTEKYNWSFVYMGMDITSIDAAENLGITSRSYTSKSSESITKSWDNISYLNTCYRNAVCTADADLAYETFNAKLTEDTTLYESQTGIKIENK